MSSQITKMLKVGDHILFFDPDNIINGAFTYEFIVDSFKNHGSFQAIVPLNSEVNFASICEELNLEVEDNQSDWTVSYLIGESDLALVDEQGQLDDPAL